MMRTELNLAVKLGALKRN